MSRRPVNPELFRAARAKEDEMDDFAAKQRRKRTTVGDGAFNRATDEVVDAMKSERWNGLAALHFVALYALMHERVYGVAPVELGPTQRLHAAGLAGKLLTREFGGDKSAMIQFVRWAWRREAGREQWRRNHNRQGARITWVFFFSGSLLTDYRVDMARVRQ